jgi:hypothetical protein
MMEDGRRVNENPFLTNLDMMCGSVAAIGEKKKKR